MTGGIASEKQAALDMLMTKQLVEDSVLQIRWTPTWKHLADPLTKDMVTSLLEHFRHSSKLCLVQAPEDEKDEVRGAGIRKAQRERRKIRMKATATLSLPDVMNQSTSICF